MRAMRLGLLASFILNSIPLLAQEPPAATDERSTDIEIQKPPREQTIYVPYEKIRNTFEKEGRGVFIPYERFQELWKAAREAQNKPPVTKPPAPAVITEADSEATVNKDVVQVTARLKIDLLESGWITVPLRLNGAGIISASLVAADGKEEPARLAVTEDGGYKLIVQNESKTARQIELRLEYAQEFKKAPGKNEVSFAAPQAPVNRWRVHVPETGVKINIDPLIAATEPPAKDDPKEAKESVVLAFVGAAPTVKIDWTAKAEGASGLAAVTTVESQQEVRIDEGALRSRIRLNYAISRAELAQLLIEVPEDQKVLNVSGSNVRQWTVETQDKQQKITVQLFEPARQTESIFVELEQFGDATNEAKAADGKRAAGAGFLKVEIPVVKAVGVSRQQGVVVIDVADGLQVEASKREGLLQVDSSDLPPVLAKEPHALAYRFAALPYVLTLDVTKIKPYVTVEELVTAYLQPENLTLNLQAAYNIERAGVFELAIDIPEGFDVREVRGETISGASPALVNGYRLEGDSKSRLIVELSHKAIGRAGVFLQLQKNLDDVNLLGPTGETSKVVLPIPRAAVDSIERTSGRLVVFAPESLRVNPAKQAGLRNVSVAEAFAGMTVSTQSGTESSRPVSSFLYSKAPIELTLDVERRKPYITVGQLLVMRVDPGVVNYEATFNYDIRYSSVKSLRIDVPSEFAAQIHNNSTGIAEKAIEPAPADVPEGYVAWNLTGERELLGPVVVTFSWERKLENLEIGKSIELSTPWLQPRDVDRAWGQVVLVKAETIDVVASGTPTGLRPIDPQHDLMPGTSIADAALAFEFHDDWSLGVTATRYQLESVKNTSIERGLVRAVFTRSKQLAVQSLYRIRSAKQRLVVELPAEVEFDTEPLRINGQPTALERGAKGEFFVPLVGRGSTEPLLVELRYLVPDSQQRVVLPSFPDEPAVQKVFISTFIPEELSLLGYQGPWTDEQIWQYQSPLRRTSASKYSDAGLIQWATEGVSLNTSPADTFPVDGQSLIYSTLRPEAGEAGSLKLSVINGKWLSGLIFAGVFGVGIALVRRPVADRAAALAALLIGLLLIGVFLPTFSTQVMYGGFWLAILLTAIVWMAAYVRRRRSKSAVATTVETAPIVESPPTPPPDNPSSPSEKADGGEHHD